MAFQQKETTIENLNKYLQDFRRQVDKGIDNQREALNVLKQTQSQLTEFHHRFNEYVFNYLPFNSYVLLLTVELDNVSSR